MMYKVPGFAEAVTLQPGQPCLHLCSRVLPHLAARRPCACPPLPPATPPPPPTLCHWARRGTKNSSRQAPHPGPELHTNQCCLGGKLSQQTCQGSLRFCSTQGSAPCWIRSSLKSNRPVFEEGGSHWEVGVRSRHQWVGSGGAKQAGWVVTDRGWELFPAKPRLFLL